jgi:hypothetical protein
MFQDLGLKKKLFNNLKINRDIRIDIKLLSSSVLVLFVLFDIRKRWVQEYEICRMSVNLLKSQQIVQFLIYFGKLYPVLQFQKKKE